MPLKISLETCYLDQVIAVVEYDKLIKKIIAELKYKSVIEVGRVCGRLIYFHANFPTVDLLVPVPLHPKKQRLRGFNQTEIMARAISELSKIRYQNALQRTVHTESQARSKSRSERLSKLQSAFALNVERRQIEGKNILLIDDVCTTGTTLNECAKILKVSGAKTVTALVLASRG